MSFVHFLLDLVGLAGTRSGDDGKAVRLGLNDAGGPPKVQVGDARVVRAGGRWIRLGWVFLALALFGAYAYADSLGHGFARNVVVEVGLLVAGVIGLAGTASGFIQEVVSGFKEGQRK